MHMGCDEWQHFGAQGDVAWVVVTWMHVYTTCVLNVDFCKHVFNKMASPNLKLYYSKKVMKKILHSTECT